MDGDSVSTRVVTWRDPRDPHHPHQMWMRAERGNRAVNVAAFLAADAALPENVMDEVWSLHDSAQYHFIQMLLLRHSDGSYRFTINDAFLLALKHHEEVSR